MRNLTKMILLSVTFFGLAPVTVFSGDKVRCDDIQWKPALRAGFADIDKACQDVVTRKGKNYVHFEVRLVRVLEDGNVKVSMTLHDGRRVERVFHAPGDFHVRSRSGKTRFDMDELNPGDVLDVYIPESRIVTASLGQRLITSPDR